MSERAAYAGPRLCDSDRRRGPAVSAAERPTRALQLNQGPLGGRERRGSLTSHGESETVIAAVCRLPAEYRRSTDWPGPSMTSLVITGLHACIGGGATLQARGESQTRRRDRGHRSPRAAARSPSRSRSLDRTGASKLTSRRVLGFEGPMPRSGMGPSRFVARVGLLLRVSGRNCKSGWLGL